MITALVIDDAGYSTSISDKIDSIRACEGIADILIVSCDSRPEGFTATQWITAENLVDGFQSAVKLTSTKRVLVFSASAEMNPQTIADFIDEALQSPLIEHSYAGVETEDGISELPEISSNEIMTSMACNEIWPMVALSTSRLSLQAAFATTQDAASIPELMLCTLIRASAQGESVRRSSAMDVGMSASMLRAVCELDLEARSRVLSCVVDSMNIEELFPNFAWKEFSQESAAAAYHALAALFLRFGDTESAVQCLAHSEKLEESPRLFALKGLIQHTRGETLGAVANMVSSLQCYENRKTPDEKHYLSFKPRNLEIVASRLVDGLNALNRQDNDKALTHFSEAVFNFDSFYSEFGVQSLEKLRN